MSLKDLEQVFGPVEEQLVATSSSMTMPSTITNKLVMDAAQTFDLDIVLRDIGIVVAREFATALDGMALRPADYALVESLPEMLASRVAGILAGCPAEFRGALVEQLRLRG